ENWDSQSRVAGVTDPGVAASARDREVQASWKVAARGHFIFGPPQDCVQHCRGYEGSKPQQGADLQRDQFRQARWRLAQIPVIPQITQHGMLQTRSKRL
ncbi:MAG: hypothetical protein V3T38_06665, partial [Gammaproteobacteria bacterium]